MYGSVDAPAKVMADEPQVAAVGALALHLGRNDDQLTVERERVLSSPSWALRATPRGSAGPPEPAPAGSVPRSSRSPGAPTV